MLARKSFPVLADQRRNSVPTLVLMEERQALRIRGLETGSEGKFRAELKLARSIDRVGDLAEGSRYIGLG